MFIPHFTNASSLTHHSRSSSAHSIHPNTNTTNSARNALSWTHIHCAIHPAASIRVIRTFQNFPSNRVTIRPGDDVRERGKAHKGTRESFHEAPTHYASVKIGRDLRRSCARVVGKIRFAVVYPLHVPAQQCIALHSGGPSTPVNVERQRCSSEGAAAICCTQHMNIPSYRSEALEYLGLLMSLSDRITELLAPAVSRPRGSAKIRMDYRRIDWRKHLHRSVVLRLSR
jgi:hypothetical protein